MFGIKTEKERMTNCVKKSGSIIYTEPRGNRSYNRGFNDGVTDLLNVLAKSPTYYAIEIPENATYGDMIMKVLESAGNYEQIEGSGVMCIHEVGTPADYCAGAVDIKLWNEPFKRGKEE